ncbi:MAG: hypothetical protein J0L84_12560 [Verrucomicrobia bacterium]|nr:hypothetical protein [Verrucomicrobiota bacterium]
MRWTPGPDQAPSTNVVRVRITDSGSPSLNAEREFTVVAWAIEERAILEIGVDDNPLVLPYVPHAEFGPENDIQDPAPGRVTRLPSDPQYDAAAIPGPDDDYYLKGLYRSGFNQLSGLLQVPNDEPWSAWERAVIPSDRTNRLHFRLTAAQAVPETWVRVIAEFPWGGTAIRGEVQPGFADHDLALRIRNANGVSSDVFSGRLSAPTRVVTEFPLSDVGAMPGPTTLEFVREGPTAPSTAFWLIYDFVRVEIDAGGNEAPVLGSIPAQTVDEGVLWNWTLTASDPDVPATSLTFGLVAGPPGLTVSPAGQMTWTPAEDQGPGTYPVTVRVTDNGIPVRSTTNGFTISVREVNRPPVPASPGTPIVNELETLRLLVAASDPDLPANAVSFALESGPGGLTVDPAGIVTWTPTEAQGPGVFPVVIRVSDDGEPPLSAPLEFEITVAEVNTLPRLAAVESQTVDRLAPLEVALVSADDDLPANVLTHSLIAGPEGATVTAAGLVRWRPEPGQAPSTNRLVVRVTDSGIPPLFAEQEFTVVALPVEERSIVQVGVDDDPDVLPYNPRAEFRGENSLMDPPPGLVTRVEGDPLYDAGSLPAADDHYYVRGLYAPGFNGLTSRLILPNDEPFSAWETALTTADPTNQIHFRLTEAQTTPGSWIRVVTEFAVGGSATGGQVNAGFGDHDVTLRFRNAAGVLTTVFEGRVNPPARLVTEFPLETVGALAGPNSIEWVRTGPAIPGTSFWLTYDFVRLEMDAGGNEAPVIADVGAPSVDEMVPWSLALDGSDGDVPPTALTYTLVSGPPGLTVSASGLIAWLPSESQGPLSHPVAVRVTDNGVPIRSTTNEFVVTVREVNRPPALAAVADQTVDELTELRVALEATDDDLPLNPLTFVVVNGPEGLTVGSDGVIRWIPTEAQGPAEYPVTVQVVDNGVPSLDAVREFRVTVREVNTPPAIAAVPLQAVDRLAPLAWSLAGSDEDLPVNALVYSLVSGPDGLTVSPSGEVAWKPEPAQAPSTHPVVVRVADNGLPPLEGLREFTVVATAVEERSVFWIGEDEDPERVPYLPYDEFNPENYLNDSPPGLATREPTDPEYVPGANPGPDDDFFMRGNYSGGFRGLAGRLVLPNDEPAQAWELALTSLDLTNRIHFRLTEAQAVPETWIRVVTEFPVGGSAVGGVVSPGFSEHEVRVAFRNAAGTETEVAARRLTEPGLVVAEFDLARVSAAAGPNSIELARTGPLSPGTAYWLSFDFVRIEVDAGGNEAPLLADVPEQTVDEQTLWTVTLEGRDTDQPPTPLTYSLVDGPPGVVVSPAGVVTWTPGEDQGPSTNLVSVRVTDNGIPVRSTTNSIVVVVREVNREPVIASVDPITANEREPLSLQLTGGDEDLPANGLTFLLVDGPSGMSVSPQGLLLWTPTEDQGPSTAQVVVRIADDGVPPMSTTRQIEVAIREVNTAPEIAEEPVQHVDRLAPLDLPLRASDADLPANGLAFTLESGPEGAIVDAGGRIRWTPGLLGLPVTNTLTIRITDDGQPPLNTTRVVTVVAWPVEERTIFQIGVNDDPASLPYEPAAEFSPANGIQDPEPGGVTLLPGDPDFDATGNPPADDDFFVRGIYPRGHHGRERQLRVASDEPPAAWEARLTPVDPVNRIHFRLTESQAVSNTWLRLVVAISSGQSGNSGAFGEHDLAFRFHNASGEMTEVFAQRVTSDGELVAEFDASRVRALPGAAMVELVRTGPQPSDGGSWIEFDHVRLEVDPGGNEAPTLAPVANQTMAEQTLLRIQLDAEDPDDPPTPLTYRVVSGPEGLTVDATGLLTWTPSESQGPSSQEVTVEVTDNGVPALLAQVPVRDCRGVL